MGKERITKRHATVNALERPPGGRRCHTDSLCHEGAGLLSFQALRTSGLPLLNRVDDMEGVQAVDVVSWKWPNMEGWTRHWNGSALDPQNPLSGPKLPALSKPVV